jgi:hypothetical protein
MSVPRTRNTPTVNTISDFPKDSCWGHSDDKELSLCCHGWEVLPVGDACDPDTDTLQEHTPSLSHRALTTVISLTLPQPSRHVPFQMPIVMEPWHWGFCCPWYLGHLRFLLPALFILGHKFASFWLSAIPLVPCLIALFSWMLRTWFS